MWASLIKKTTPIGDGKHFFATTHDLLHMRSSAVSRHCTVLNIQLIPSPQVEDIFFQQLTFSEVIHSTMRFRITRLWPSTLGCGSEHAGSTARPDWVVHGLDFRGRRPDFLYGSVFGFIDAKTCEWCRDHAQLDEISLFVHSNFWKSTICEILNTEKVFWSSKARVDWVGRQTALKPPAPTEGCPAERHTRSTLPSGGGYRTRHWYDHQF